MQQFYPIQEQTTPLVPIGWTHDRTHSNSVGHKYFAQVWC